MSPACASVTPEVGLTVIWIMPTLQVDFCAGGGWVKCTPRVVRKRQSNAVAIDDGGLTPFVSSIAVGYIRMHAALH
jgi:hypothetical protein